MDNQNGTRAKHRRKAARWLAKHGTDTEQSRSGDGQAERDKSQAQTLGGPLGGGAHFKRKAARPEARQCGSGDGQPERDKSQARTQGGPLVREA